MGDNFQAEHLVELVTLLWGEGVEGLRHGAGVALHERVAVALQLLQPFLAPFQGG